MQLYHTLPYIRLDAVAFSMKLLQSHLQSRHLQQYLTSELSFPGVSKQIIIALLDSLEQSGFVT